MTATALFLSRGLGVVRGGSSPIVAANNVAIVSGDSTGSTTGPYSGSAAAYRIDTGWMVWARQMLKGQTDWNKANDIGTGGITSPTYVSTYLGAAIAQAQASGASHAFLSLFINDTFDANNVTTPQSFAAADAIFNAYRAAGIVVFFTNTWPSTGATWNSTKAVAIRDYLRSKNDPSKGLYLVESWNTIATAPDALTYKTDYVRADGIHLATLGAQGIGRLAYTVCTPALPANDIATTLTWANVANFSGSAAVATANITGTVPTGFLAQQGAIASGAVTLSNITESSVPKILMVATDVANGASAATYSLAGLSGSLTGFVAGTDFVDSMVRVEISNHPVSGKLEGINQIGAVNRRNGGQNLPSLGDSGRDAASAGTASVYVFDGQPIDVYLRPPAYVLTAGATQLYMMWLDINIGPNMVGNFQAKISLCRNRVKTSLTDP